MFDLITRYTNNEQPRLNEAETNCAILINLLSGGRSGFQVGALFESCGVTVIPLLECTGSSKTKNDRLAELAQIIESGGYVIIAGGDGTASWGMEVIEQCCVHHDLAFPFVVLYPIGTGNDLSRSIGWGNKQPSLKRSAVETLLHKYRKRLDEGSCSTLDRWGLRWTFTDPSNTNTVWGRGLPKNFLCYVSVGYDARIAYEFEIDRQGQDDDVVTTAASNHMVYVYHGSKELFSPMPPLTSEDVRLWVDGEEVELPEGTRSLKILNINSAMNGLFCWGTSPSNPNELQEWTPPRLDDQKMEVVTTNGLKNMLGYRLNYSHAHRVAQTKHVVWEIMREMEIQVDGEAWIQKPCRLEFFLRDQIPVLIGKYGCRGVEEEVLTIQSDPSSVLGAVRKQRISRLSALACKQLGLETQESTI